ncbi:MAG TPA: PadR family transcriptional regulator [Clostridia bacterium]|nr:PadR family transcriptional regulator [Clostridia bacterium]
MTRLYILHKATKEPVFSAGMKEEYERHRVLLSARSVASMLRGMQDKGYFEPAARRNGRPLKAYVATRRGQLAIERTRDKLRVLFDVIPTTGRGDKRFDGLPRAAKR